jgi:hypothetical protein|tara:strand:+ start:2003 stop:2350 length:348 start_codon:yes stop_codon:yes gene_type:complete
MSKTGEYFLEGEQYMKEEQDLIECEMHMLETSYEKIKAVITKVLTARGYKESEIRYNLNTHPLSINLRYDYWNVIDDATLREIESKTGMKPKHWDDFDDDTGYINGYELHLKGVA